MSDCKAYLREIEDVAEGVAPGGVARAHAESCRACGGRLRELESLRGLVRGLGKVEAPADFEFRLRARMASANSAGRRGPFGGLRSAYRLAPVAAAACFLIVSASLYLWQSSRTGPSTRARGGASEVTGGAAAPQSRAASAPTVIEVSSPSKAGQSHRDAGASSNLSRAAGRRQYVAARRSKEPAQKPGGSGGQAVFNTTVASLNSAEVIRRHTMTIPLETAAAPLRLVLRDERGAARVVPVRAVSFGAQDLIAREGVRRQTTEADDEGVW